MDFALHSFNQCPKCRNRKKVISSFFPPFSVVFINLFPLSSSWKVFSIWCQAKLRNKQIFSLFQINFFFLSFHSTVYCHYLFSLTLPSHLCLFPLILFKIVSRSFPFLSPSLPQTWLISFSSFHLFYPPIFTLKKVLFSPYLCIHPCFNHLANFGL